MFILKLVLSVDGGFNLKRVKQEDETRSVSEDGVLYFRTLPKSPKYDKRCSIFRHKIWFSALFYTDAPCLKMNRKEWTGNVGTICSISQWGSLVWLGWSKYTNYHFNFAKFIFTLSSRSGITKLDRMWLMDYEWTHFASLVFSCQFYPLVKLCRLQGSAAG